MWAVLLRSVTLRMGEIPQLVVLRARLSKGVRSVILSELKSRLNKGWNFDAKRIKKLGMLFEGIWGKFKRIGAVKLETLDYSKGNLKQLFYALPEDGLVG